MSHSKLHIQQRICSVESDEDFADLASETFDFQRRKNLVYQRYLESIGFDQSFNADSPPFLPIEAFKHHRVSCFDSIAETVFLSSGTTQKERSEHHVYDVALYDFLARSHFESLYGPIDELILLALLPSYVEAGSSSLVHMVHSFMKQSKEGSQFVLNDPKSLEDALQHHKESGSNVLLIGVSFALLDFAELHSFDYDRLTIMETGGMKGRRKELTRSELHEKLNHAFPSSRIDSEYGMTELLSQAYSSDGKWFIPPKWMKAFTTDISDPFLVQPAGTRGILAFVDLANHYSCSFIQTRDIGIVKEDGTFSVEGRMDGSDLRGCNLLYAG